MDLDPKQIQQMIALLQAMLPAVSDSEDTTEEKPATKKPKANNKTPKNNIKTKRHKRPTDTTHTNIFDTMMESRLHKEDSRIDKLLCVNEPTPRVRKFIPLEVTCRVCGKKDKINPVLLTDSQERYKCNKCARSAG